MKPGSRSQIGGNVKEKHICTNFVRLLCPDFVFVNFDEDLLASLFHFQVPYFSIILPQPKFKDVIFCFSPTPHTKCRRELKENERQVLIVVWRNSNCLYAKQIFSSFRSADLNIRGLGLDEVVKISFQETINRRQREVFLRATFSQFPSFTMLENFDASKENKRKTANCNNFYNSSSLFPS